MKFLFTVRTRSCGEVMFSLACVRNSVQKGAVHPSGQTGRQPLRQTPTPRQTPPWTDTSPVRHPLDRHPLSHQTATAADSTHLLESILVFSILSYFGKTKRYSNAIYVLLYFSFGVIFSVFDFYPFSSFFHCKLFLDLLRSILSWIQMV